MLGAYGRSDLRRDPRCACWIGLGHSARGVKAGVHRPPVGGISGTSAQGANSIVVSGGYEDDLDLGDELIYTGAVGNDPETGAQVAELGRHFGRRVLVNLDANAVAVLDT
jgi:putative restriction endonuclease